MHMGGYLGQIGVPSHWYWLYVFRLVVFCHKLEQCYHHKLKRIRVPTNTRCFWSLSLMLENRSLLGIVLRQAACCKKTRIDVCPILDAIQRVFLIFLPVFPSAPSTWLCVCACVFFFILLSHNNEMHTETHYTAKSFFEIWIFVLNIISEPKFWR